MSACRVFLCDEVVSSAASAAPSFASGSASTSGFHFPHLPQSTLCTTSLSCAGVAQEAIYQAAEKGRAATYQGTPIPSERRVSGPPKHLVWPISGRRDESRWTETSSAACGEAAKRPPTSRVRLGFERDDCPGHASMNRTNRSTGRPPKSQPEMRTG
eukprot:4304904-Prymnesium_polylepis.1